MLAVTVALGSGCALLRDERGKACGFLDEPVAAQFAMAHASDYRLHIPMMGKSPELDINPAPAFVVAFAGPIDLPVLGAPAPAGAGPAAPHGPEQGVICVMIGGETTYYENVDMTGWRP